RVSVEVAGDRIVVRRADDRGDVGHAARAGRGAGRQVDRDAAGVGRVVQGGRAGAAVDGARDIPLPEDLEIVADGTAGQVLGRGEREAAEGAGVGAGDLRDVGRVGAGDGVAAAAAVESDRRGGDGRGHAEGVVAGPGADHHVRQRAEANRADAGPR